MVDERGSIAIFGCLICLVLSVLLISFASHSNYVSTSARLDTIAEEAARIGAQELDLVEYLQSGEIRLDARAAQQQVLRFIDEQADAMRVDLVNLQIRGEEVRVVVTATASQPFSSDRQVTASGVAKLLGD